MQRDPSLFNLPVPTFEAPTTAGSEKRWVDAVQSTLPAANGRTTTDVPSRDIEIADPHEVAFLRGGEIEVMRLYLFDLVQPGYLEVIETRKWLTTERRLAVSRNPPPYDALTGTERAILNWFAPLMTIDEALKLHTREPVKSVCDRYREQLEANGQFESSLARERRTAVYVGGLVACFMLGAAGWQIVGIVTGVVASIAAQMFFRRLSPSGRERLDDLEARFSHLKERPRAAKLNVADPALVTAVAVFGTTILAGSPYDAFAAAVGSGSGWSFSLGADGGCAGGCDGGCGGCGGCCG